MGDVVVLASPPRDPIRSSTTSGGASVRCTRAAPRRLLLPRRDGLDLQHDGVVYMVENFSSRASPTNIREGERKGSRAARVGGEGVGGWCAPTPLYIEGGAALAPPPSPNWRPQRIRSGGQGNPPF